MALSPFDDYLIHQIPETLDHVGTSDRNFYDRYYFNLHNKSSELFAIMGLGVYPNLNIIDAFVAVMYEGVQRVVWASRILGDDRSDTSVGPLSVKVVEGLRSLDLRCEPNDWDIEFELRWDAFTPAFYEPPSTWTAAAKTTNDSRRFSQTGRWTGSLDVAGHRFEVEPDGWWGSRDHSWGIREISPPARPGWETTLPKRGGFINWAPIKFDDFGFSYFVYELSDGTRYLEDAVRVASIADGGAITHYGSPRHEFEFVPGTTTIKRGTVYFPDPATGRELTLQVEPLTHLYLHKGMGYGGDWHHGDYQGDPFVGGAQWPDAECPVLGGVDTALCRFDLDGAIGYSVMDTVVSDLNYPRYGFSGGQ